MEGLTSDSIRRAIPRLKAKLEACAGELNELDGALGDGDLGVNLARSLERLNGDAAALPEDVGLALLRCAQAFTSIAASTYGTLVATGLMAAAKAAKGRTAVPWAEVPALLEAAREAMASRGKAQLGDKTVLDAVEAARRAAEGLEAPAALVEAAGQGVAAAMDALRERPFRQGRARIFGAKGIGRDDPGMVAFQRMVEGLAG
ncbi:MAG: dihydroxyacetone kinase subunit L [Bryobacterales bacterium]|nr:dihydroxyacetone kinase subunit L [Bryobacterales bacterium]